jgi:hypothetical protein
MGLSGFPDLALKEPRFLLWVSRQCEASKGAEPVGVAFGLGSGVVVCL